jgi:hypothetical protein
MRHKRIFTPQHQPVYQPKINTGTEILTANIIRQNDHRINSTTVPTTNASQSLSRDARVIHGRRKD